MNDGNKAATLLGFVSGVVLGAFIGASAGLLLAPDSGEVTRRKVKDAGAKAIQNSQKAVANFKTETIDPLVNQVGEGVKTKYEQAKTKISR